MPRRRPKHERARSSNPTYGTSSLSYFASTSFTSHSSGSQAIADFLEMKRPTASPKKPRPYLNVELRLTSPPPRQWSRECRKSTPTSASSINHLAGPCPSYGPGDIARSCSRIAIALGQHRTLCTCPNFSRNWRLTWTFHHYLLRPDGTSPQAFLRASHTAIGRLESTRGRVRSGAGKRPAAAVRRQLRRPASTPPAHQQEHQYEISSTSIKYHNGMDSAST